MSIGIGGVPAALAVPIGARAEEDHRDDRDACRESRVSRPMCSVPRDARAWMSVGIQNVRPYWPITQQK